MDKYNGVGITEVTRKQRYEKLDNIGDFTYSEMYYFTAF